MIINTIKLLLAQKMAQIQMETENTGSVTFLGV